jgi:hypothetical protein
MLSAVEAGGFGAIGAAEVIEETLSRLRILETAGLITAPVSEAGALLTTAQDWLLPLLRRKGASVPAPHEVRDALVQSFDWPVQEALRREAPLTLDLPSGQEARVDWLDPRAPPSTLHSRQGVPANASATVKAGGLAEFVGLAHGVSAAATREATRAAARNHGTGNLIPATLPGALSAKQSATLPATLLPTPQSATLAATLPQTLPPTPPLTVPAPCHTGSTRSSCDTIIGQNTSGSEATEGLDTVPSGIASCEEQTGGGKTRGIGSHLEEWRDTVGIHVSGDAAPDQGTEATSRYEDRKLASPWAGLQPCARREDCSNTLDDDKDSGDRTTFQVDSRCTLKCEACVWAFSLALICCSSSSVCD